MRSIPLSKENHLPFQDDLKAKKNETLDFALKLNDIIQEEEDLTLSAAKYIQTELPTTLEALIAFYSEAPASEESPQRSGFSSGNIVRHIQHPLHIAARDGDIETIIKLLDDGFDINDKDTRNIMPIHVAALFGQNEVINTLISRGADVNATGYENNTPLHFALLKQHYDVANTLIIDGGASTTLTNHDQISPMTLIVDVLAENISTDSAKETDESRHQFNQSIALLRTAALRTDEAVLYSDVSEFDNTLYLTPYPVSVILTVLASMTSSLEEADDLLKLADEISAHDANQVYINAKDLLHYFPTGEIYKIDLGQDKKIWMISEGHLGIYTTTLAAESLQQFTENLPSDTSPQKMEVFQSLQAIYDHAVSYTSFAGLDDTAFAALERYHDGQTVLLPSGWDGHFIDVILSKPHGLYLVANSGDRYRGETAEDEGDPAGIIFYQMHEPDAIDAQFMYNILNNADKMVLEYENAYEYGLFEKVDEIVRDTQAFGNCGWESHRDAIEGLLYIELLNRDVASSEAKELAHHYYEEWDTFHGTYVIDQYMNNHPGLPLQAMLDIFTQLHQKDHFTANDKLHAQKIAETFVSEHYIEDFTTWLLEEDHDLADKLMINILQEQHGIDIEGIMTSALTHHETSIETQFESLSLVTIDPIPALHQEQLI